MNMFLDLINRIGEDGLLRVELPLASRNPNRLERRLSFTEWFGYYWIILCSGLSCRACGFREKPVVRIERVRDRDILSDLIHVVPRITVECCGRVVAVGEWRGSRIVIDGFDCDVLVRPYGVDCGGLSCSSGLMECLRQCMG